MEPMTPPQFTIGMLLQATFFVALALACILLPIVAEFRAHVLLASSGALVGTFARKTILGALLGVMSLYTILGFVTIFEALSRGILY